MLYLAERVDDDKERRRQMVDDTLATQLRSHSTVFLMRAALCEPCKMTSRV